MTDDDNASAFISTSIKPVGRLLYDRLADLRLYGEFHHDDEAPPHCLFLETSA